MFSLEYANSYLRTGEADEVGTETEAGTLTGRDTDGGRDQIQNGEDGGGDKSERGDLIERLALAGDKDGGTRNDEALDQVLDCTIDYFTKVHLILYSWPRNFLRSRKHRGKEI